jgi:hypothetical protein
LAIPLHILDIVQAFVQGGLYLSRESSIAPGLDREQAKRYGHSYQQQDRAYHAPLEYPPARFPARQRAEAKP